MLMSIEISRNSAFLQAQISLEFFLLINVKMQTIVGILTFMSNKKIKHKCFITSGQSEVCDHIKMILASGNQPILVYYTRIVNGLYKIRTMCLCFLLFFFCKPYLCVYLLIHETVLLVINRLNFLH